MKMTLEGSGTTTLYRVIGLAGLQDPEQFGDCGLNPRGGGANTWLRLTRAHAILSTRTPTEIAI